jgi:hypothetical protein
VLEGSQPDPAESSPPAEATTPPAVPPQGEEQEPVVTTESTPEQIEAIWKNRVAGKDRAHNAEVTSLREQVAERDRQLAAKRTKEEGEMSDYEREKARADAAEERATEVERQRVLDTRTLKYPSALEALDEATFAGMDEAKLAALNARLTGDEAPTSPPQIMDPSAAPKRTSAPPASPRDKPVAELEDDLKKYAPEWQQESQ